MNKSLLCVIRSIANRRARRNRRAVKTGTAFDRLEDRTVPASLSINNAFVSEGNSGTTDAIFTVFLSEASTQTVTVDFFTANGTAAEGVDYESKTGTLSFAPGDTS